MIKLFTREDITLSTEITKSKQTKEGLLQNDQIWKAIVTASPDGIGLISLDGKLKVVSDKLATMYGYLPDEMVGNWVIDFVESSYHKLLTESICKLLSSKEKSLLTEYKGINKNGNRFIVEVTSSTLKDSRGKPTSILIVERDITKRKAAEEALKISEEKYVAIFDESPIAIIVYDGKGMLTHVNKACIKLFDIENVSDITNLNLFNDMKLDHDLKAKILAHKNIRFETELDGELAKKFSSKKIDPLNIKYLDVSLKTMDDNTKTYGYIAQILDITEQIKAREEIEYLGNHDRLTGLYNRRFYEDELVRLDINRNLPISIIMADVNGLKLTNDSFGHAFGDELIKKTAEIIKNVCRGDEIIARLGGDEFVVLLPKTDANEAEKILERITKLASTEKVANIDISISFGCETKANDDEDFQEIFKRAEDNMYKNKLNESVKVKNEMINNIMNLLYKKSEWEKLHSKRVSEICEMIASKMGFDEETISQVKIAGLMHDIGKFGIDEKILNKKQELNTSEQNEIKKHAEIGYHILSSVNEFSKIANYILEHHERIDGKGYPKGIKGNQISIQGRIVAVADTYDTMTRSSSYQKAISEEDAIAELKSYAGAWYDTRVVNVLMEIIN